MKSQIAEPLAQKSRIAAKGQPSSRAPRTAALTPAITADPDAIPEECADKRTSEALGVLTLHECLGSADLQRLLHWARNHNHMPEEVVGGAIYDFLRAQERAEIAPSADEEAVPDLNIPSFGHEAIFAELPTAGAMKFYDLVTEAKQGLDFYDCVCRFDGILAMTAGSPFFARECHAMALIVEGSRILDEDSALMQREDYRNSTRTPNEAVAPYIATPPLNLPALESLSRRYGKSPCLETTAA